MVLNLIEGAIIRLAAKNMNEKKENELKSIMEQMKRGFEKKDTHKNVMLSMKLHDFIRKASENTLLIQIHQYLNVQEQKFRKTSIMKSGDIAEIFKEHMAISETLLKRDENKAELLMKNHLDKARLRVLKNLNIGRGKIFPSSYEH